MYISILDQFWINVSNWIIWYVKLAKHNYGHRIIAKRSWLSLWWFEALVMYVNLLAWHIMLVQNSRPPRNADPCCQSGSFCPALLTRCALAISALRFPAKSSIVDQTGIVVSLAYTSRCKVGYTVLLFLMVKVNVRTVFSKWSSKILLQKFNGRKMSRSIWGAADWDTNFIIKLSLGEL